jgi:hypothetical protein
MSFTSLQCNVGLGWKADICSARRAVRILKRPQYDDCASLDYSAALTMIVAATMPGERAAAIP